MRRPRVALIGARRVRQGLGPFVARYLLEHGAELAGIVASSPASARAAVREIEALGPGGLEGYTDLATLVAREAPDAVTILSPHATHARYLEAALALGLHVLCEKPLLWGGTDLAAQAESLAARFRERGLLLRENCQWPHVLPAYHELFPESRGTAPASFAMQLAPAATGPQDMLADSLSHPLSVLQALLPDPGAGIDRIQCCFDPGAGRPTGRGKGGDGQDRAAMPRLDVAFRYGGRIEVEIRLEPSTTLPRPAALALDGRWARREVREPGYAIYLTSGARSVKVADPLGALVGSFVAELHGVLSGHRPGDPGDVAQRMRLFESVLVESVECGVGQRLAEAEAAGAASASEAAPTGRAGRTGEGPRQRGRSQ